MPSLLPTPEPADPVEGQPGHFEHSNWLKASVKALDSGVVHKDGDTMTNTLRVTSDANVPLFVARAGRATIGLNVNSNGHLHVVNDPGSVPVPISAAEPVAPENLTTKNYVDNKLRFGIYNGVTSGPGEFLLDPGYTAEPWANWGIVQGLGPGNAPYDFWVDRFAGSAVVCKIARKDGSGAPYEGDIRNVSWIAGRL